MTCHSSSHFFSPSRAGWLLIHPTVYLAASSCVPSSCPAWTPLGLPWGLAQQGAQPARKDAGRRERGPASVSAGWVPFTQGHGPCKAALFTSRSGSALSGPVSGLESVPPPTSAASSPGGLCPGLPHPWESLLHETLLQSPRPARPDWHCSCESGVI